MTATKRAKRRTGKGTQRLDIRVTGAAAEPAHDDAGVQAPADLDLGAVLAELGSGSDGHVSVYRIVARQGTLKNEFLFQCEPAQFRVQDIQASYGAGDYEVVVQGRSAEHPRGYGIITRRRLSIGESLEQRRAAPQAAPSEFAAVLAAIAEQGKQTQALIQQLAQQQAGGGMGAIKELVAVAGPILLPLLRRPAAPPAPPPSRGADPVAGLEQAMRLAEMFDRFRGDRGGGDTDSVFAREAFGLVRSMIERGGAPAGAGAAGSPETPVPPAAPSLSPMELEEEMLRLRGQLAIYLNAAGEGADVETYAALAYEALPDEVFDQLRSAKWFDHLCLLEPKCREHSAWFEKLRARVLEIESEATDATPADAAPAATKKG